MASQPVPPSTFLAALTLLALVLGPRHAGVSAARPCPEACPGSRVFPDLYQASISELQQGLERGDYSSVDLVNAYLKRIDEVNTQGPALRAVIETSPVALQQAREADELRKQGKVLSPLHGVPILLKDNIATRAEDGMNTTAGSYALVGALPPADATVARKLREAGAVLLGKTGLSEWANFRGFYNANGWSGRGGQATSAFFPQGDGCGSSTGSGIATSVGLAACSIGTETDGSIICPANRNNVVGIKPTVGLTSRNLVIPIAQSQDSVGPMCASVADAAAVLSIIAGPDPEDKFSLAQPMPVPDYTQHLKADGLKGARIGVLRGIFTNGTVSQLPEYAIEQFNAVVNGVFKDLGAHLVDPVMLENDGDFVTQTTELTVLEFEFKVGVNEYLSRLTTVPSNATDLEGLIKFNDENAELELPPGRDNQNLFLQSQNTTSLEDPVYLDAMKANQELGHRIDAALEKYNLEALILPAEGFFSEGPAALVGYPMISVPLGFLPSSTTPNIGPNTTEQFIPIYPAPNMPFGLAFIGPAYSEARLIELAYSYEQATSFRTQSKPFDGALPKTQLQDIVCS